MDFKRKKLRDAELIVPPNKLRGKVGYGGIDTVVLQKAQELIEKNTGDFIPVAEMYLTALAENISKAQKGDFENDEIAIEALITPAMQLKGQGAMFNYPLITEICSILVSFLEVVKKLDGDAFDAVLAHKMTLKAVISSRIESDGGAQGRALVDALKDACVRYFQNHR